jgi:hypothetical protein
MTNNNQPRPPRYSWIGAVVFLGLAVAQLWLFTTCFHAS